MSKKHTSSKNMARNIVSYIFAFGLSLVLLALTVLLLLRFGLFSQTRFLSILDGKYYELCLSNIEDQSYYYTLPTGIDPSVLDGVFTLEEVKQDVDQYVIAAFQGSEFTPNLVGATERISANAIAFFQGSGVEITEETEEIVSAYAEDIMDIYTTYARMPGLDLIVQAKGLFSRYFLIGVILLGILALVLVVLLVRLHHFLHRSLRYVAYALGGTALMSFAAPFVIFISRSYLGLNLEPEYFYRFGVSLIQHVLLLCFFASACWLLLMVITIILIGVLRYRAIHTYD